MYRVVSHEVCLMKTFHPSNLPWLHNLQKCCACIMADMVSLCVTNASTGSAASLKADHMQAEPIARLMQHLLQLQMVLATLSARMQYVHQWSQACRQNRLSRLN